MEKRQTELQTIYENHCGCGQRTNPNEWIQPHQNQQTQSRHEKGTDLPLKTQTFQINTIILKNRHNQHIFAPNDTFK